MSTFDVVCQTIAERHSVRLFDLNEAIPRELLTAIVAAGREGPSGRNFQPLRLHVLPTFAAVQSLGVPLEPTLAPMMGRSLPVSNHLFYDATAAVVITMREDTPADQQTWAEVDAAFAAANMETAAKAAGYDSITVGLIRLFPDQVKELLGLKDGEKVILAVGFGKSSDGYTIPKPERRTEVVWH